MSVRENLDAMSSRQKSALITLILLMIPVTSASHLVIAYAALSLFVLAKIIRYASQVVYYWKGI